LFHIYNDHIIISLPLQHIFDSDSWIQEQEGKDDGEGTKSQLDAKLELDAFNRQYDQIRKSRADLISKGRGIALEIEQLDVLFFGSEVQGHTPHPAGVRVEEKIARMVAASQRLEGVAQPHLQQLQKLYKFHSLKEKSSRVSQSRECSGGGEL